MNWYNDHDNLYELCQYLYDEGYLINAEDVIRVIEKPWKWQNEYDEMLQKMEDAESDRFEDSINRSIDSAQSMAEARRLK